LWNFRQPSKFFPPLCCLSLFSNSDYEQCYKSRLDGIIPRQSAFNTADIVLVYRICDLPNVFLKFEFQDDRLINVAAVVGRGGQNLSSPINKGSSLMVQLVANANAIPHQAVTL